MTQGLPEIDLDPHYYNYVRAKFNTYKKELKHLENYMPVLDYSKTEEAYDQHQRDLKHNTICPHCKNQTEYLHDSTFIYAGIDKGPIYYCACKPGGVYVGCHKNNPRIPLGFPADKHLRQYRIKAHKHFDILWTQYHEKIKNRDGNQFTLNQCREIAYHILASHMNVTQTQYAHIGWFDVKQCRRVIKLCLDSTLLRSMVTLDSFKAMQLMVEYQKETNGIIIDLEDDDMLFNAWVSLTSDILKASYIKPGRSKKKRKKRR